MTIALTTRPLTAAALANDPRFLDGAAAGAR